MNRFNLAQLFGLIGVATSVAGVFRPVLAVGGLGMSLYDVGDVIAWPLLIVAALTLACVGIRQWLGVVVLGITTAVIGGYRLANLMAAMSERQKENDYQLQQNRGWGELLQAMTPTLSWQGWALIFAGAAIHVILGVAEIIRLKLAGRTGVSAEST